jgi:hypothetical protein
VRVVEGGRDGDLAEGEEEAVGRLAQIPLQVLGSFGRLCRASEERIAGGKDLLRKERIPSSRVTR